MSVMGCDETGTAMEFPSVLAWLEDARVLSVKLTEDGTYRLREECDRWFCEYLTREQLRMLSDELRDMAKEGSADDV